MVEFIVLVYFEGALVGARGPFDTYVEADSWAKAHKPGDQREVLPLQAASK